MQLTENEQLQYTAKEATQKNLKQAASLSTLTSKNRELEDKAFALQTDILRLTNELKQVGPLIEQVQAKQQQVLDL